MTYTGKFPSGPLEGALVMVDTDLPVAAVAVVNQMPNSALNVTFHVTDQTIEPRRLIRVLREAVDHIEARINSAGT